MADTVLDGLIGGESGAGGAEQAETASDGKAQVGAEAFAAAIVMNEAKDGSPVGRAARAYLEKQGRLVDAQSEHVRVQTLHALEERPLRISNLESQSVESRLRQIGQVIRIGIQALTVAVLAVVGLGLIVMVSDAFASRSVVVEPFDAPAGLAAQGLSGKVVASGLLDELTRLQAATRSSAVKRNLSDAWTGEIKIDVPETGVSIGEIDRLLKARFGHDLHIGGDLVQAANGGYALTVRGDGVLPKTFTGAAGDLAKLTTGAAEYVYGQSQPGQYATYLLNAGRNADAVVFCKSAYPSAAKSEQPYILNEWGDALENTGAPAADAMTLYRAALKIKPDFWTAYANLMNADWLTGDEEGGWRTGEALRTAAGGRPGRAPEVMYVNWDTFVWNLLPERASTQADAEAHAGIGTLLNASGTSLADIDIRLHDPASAAFDLRTVQGDPSDPTVPTMTHFVQGRLAQDAGDAARAATEMEAFGAAYANPVVSSNYPGYTCWIAPAEEAAGHPDKADAVLNAAGRYVDCYRFRGDILDHRGDWARAQQAYAAAVALAPDLPAGYYSWGLALGRHGDLAGAEAKLSAANARGPHWADPLKAWGDILARQGRRAAALAKYDAALQYAPAWDTLKRARATLRGDWGA